MRNGLPRSTHVSCATSMCAFALLYCAVNVRPSFAQNQNNQGQNNVDWQHYGNALTNQRYQDVDQINPSNVAKLKPAWIFHTGTPDANTAMEMTPIEQNGVVYVPTGVDVVYALNAATGKQMWVYQPTDMPAPANLPVCCNNDNRGIALGDGKVFVARLDANLVALDQATGKVVWKTAVDLPSNGAAMTLAPQFADNKVIVGVSGAEFGVRSHVDAYNPDNGNLIWRFYTTEPNTWSGNSYLVGGASVWGTPTYDPDLHMLYFSTGNTYPWPDASFRGGLNLYACSIVALDITTGELAWYFQEIHHDLWDFDGPQPTVLFDVNGTPAISHTAKPGWTYVLNRATGKPILPYTEVPVPPTPANAAFQQPWPTQPESSVESLEEHTAANLPAGYTAAPIWATIGPTPMVFQPFADGVQWPPAAYSPRTHFLYSHSRYSPANVGILNDPTNNGKCPGSKCQWTGGFGPIPGQSPHGVYGAINTVTGKIAWKDQMTPGFNPDSGISVAGDLVFFGESNGLFHAANAQTGNILWTFDASKVPNAGGANGSPAIYVVNGKEYVVYGFGGEPGESPVLGDAVIAFALPDGDN